MIRSMTGFGTGEAVGDGWRVHVTVRSLNHRYRTVRVRTPGDWPQLQSLVEEAVKARLDRGDITLWVVTTRTGEDGDPAPFDRDAVRQALAALRGLAAELGLAEEPTLSHLIQLGVLQDPLGQEAPSWEVIHKALGLALDGVLAAREAEGAALGAEFERILTGLEEALAIVEERVPAVTEELRDRLLQRIESLDLSLDPGRLETEIALLADRLDVREEVSRLEGHILRAHALLGIDEPAGRKLDFLAQELLREANTLGSKSRDLSIHACVLDMKVGIDRLKEQAQNVE